MTATITTTSTRTLRGRLGAAALAAGLVAAGAGMPIAPAHAASTAAGLPANCDLVDHDATTWVECVVTDSGTVTFDDLVHPVLVPDDSATVAMTARGGSGATLAGANGGRSGGAGGTASTVAIARDIDRLHLYIGQDAATGSRAGGSATVVAQRPIQDVTTIDDTWLVAGGGGAQGAWMRCGQMEDGPYYGGAGGGGDGGTAVASPTGATGAGHNGGSGSTSGCSGKSTGHPGTGGDRGVAGTNHGDPRSNGVDGVGGHGGGNGWQGDVLPGFEPGSGGTTSVYAQGGGGWGGGGGGERNGGGGGGGSWAHAAATHTDVPTSHPSSPSVTLAWPLTTAS